MAAAASPAIRGVVILTRPPSRLSPKRPPYPHLQHAGRTFSRRPPASAPCSSAARRRKRRTDLTAALPLIDEAVKHWNIGRGADDKFTKDAEEQAAELRAFLRDTAGGHGGGTAAARRVRAEDRVTIRLAIHGHPRGPRLDGRFFFARFREFGPRLEFGPGRQFGPGRYYRPLGSRAGWWYLARALWLSGRRLPPARQAAGRPTSAHATGSPPVPPPAPAPAPPTPTPTNTKQTPELSQPLPHLPTSYQHQHQRRSIGTNGTITDTNMDTNIGALYQHQHQP